MKVVSSLHLERRSYAAGTSLHRHEFHQLVLPRTGMMQIEIGGREGKVDQHTAAFVPAGDSHAFEAQGEHSFLVLDISRETFPSGISGGAAVDQLAQRKFIPMSPALEHLAAYAASFVERGLPDPAAWANLLLATVATGASTRTEGPVDRARTLMEANLDKPLGIDTIAREAGASTRHLHRLFREVLGTTPHAYLARRRADRAMEMLGQTSLSIAEVAHLTGHADQSVLTRALKKFHGVTPAAHRRRGGSKGGATGTSGSASG